MTPVTPNAEPSLTKDTVPVNADAAAFCHVHQNIAP
jgi:hypothetical protein